MRYRSQNHRNCWEASIMFWFATSDDHAKLTRDDLLAAAAMRDSGMKVTPLVWGQFPERMRARDVVVVRSCWDYHLAPSRFKSWLQALSGRGVHVANGVEIIEWNLHKEYLLELNREHGISIPQTLLIPSGERRELADVMVELGGTQVVVKPAISLSAHNTELYMGLSSEAEATFAAQCAHNDVLVQTFLPEIRNGEYSLVFFENQFSHAVLKTPVENDFRVQQDHGGIQRPIEPPDTVIEQAERVLSATGAIHSFARVDGVMIGGEFVLMELELIDPVLFFGQGGRASTNRFVRAMRSLRDEVSSAP
jgi:glutathione synthase/RimK-type ligase-like ATP-grasp enzyme